MNYKDAFAIEEKSCLNQNENDYKFNLKNYNHFEPRLIDDFYFKYFIRTLLFETKTIELRAFLQHHYDFCNNPELYYSVLEFEVIPKIEEIIDKYNKLEDEIKHKNDEINKLTEKIDNVEKRIEQMSHSYFEFSVNNMYETSEEEEKDILTEEIQITEFNHNEPLEPIIKLPERNTLIEHFDEQNEYNCVVIENINNVTQLSASFCSNSNSKNNINSNFEKDDIRSRSRSNSFTDIIRSGHGLATKFFFG